jgi:hypothetical protein
MNPFPQLLSHLSNTEWRLVTIEFLTLVHDLVNQERKLISTFGEAFDVLRFLEDADVVELEPVDSAGVFKIRKKV